MYFAVLYSLNKFAVWSSKNGILVNLGMGSKFPKTLLLFKGRPCRPSHQVPIYAQPSGCLGPDLDSVGGVGGGGVGAYIRKVAQ